MDTINVFKTRVLFVLQGIKQRSVCSVTEKSNTVVSVSAPITKMAKEATFLYKDAFRWQRLCKGNGRH